MADVKNGVSAVDDERDDDRAVRVVIRVPAETREEIYKLADETGLQRSHFLSTALVMGSRSLARRMQSDA